MVKSATNALDQFLVYQSVCCVCRAVGGFTVGLPCGAVRCGVSSVPWPVANRLCRLMGVSMFTVDWVTSAFDACILFVIGSLALRQWFLLCETL